MALDPSLFQTAEPIADYSIRIANSMDDFIADKIFVPQPVKQRQYKRFQYDLSNKRERLARKNSKAKADVIDWGVTSTTGEVGLRKFQAEIDPADQRDFDPVVGDLPTDAALTLTEQLLIAKERDALNKLVIGNFATGLSTTLTNGTTRWGDGTTANPASDVAIARAAVRTACGKSPTAVAMSATMFERLKTLAPIVDRVKYTTPGAQVDQQIIANLFGVKNLYICGGVSTTANEGAASQTLADMWGNFVLVFVEGQQGRRTMSFGNNFTMNNGMYSRSWMDNDRGAEQPINMMEIGWWYDIQPGAVDTFASGKFQAGYFIGNVY